MFSAKVLVAGVSSLLFVLLYVSGSSAQGTGFCEDSNPACSRVPLSECRTNLNVIRQCKKRCNLCDEASRICRDDHQSCPRYASRCEFDTNIKRTCRKTCQLCVESEKDEVTEVCEDLDPSCPRAFSQCQSSCKVRRQCKKTCKLCVEVEDRVTEVCEDLHPSCPRVFSQCQSSSRVRSQCKKTCKLCVEGGDRGVEVCEDTHPHCSRQSSNCQSSVNVMRRCRKTCNLCAEGGWSKWSDWEMCDVTCGEGKQARSRKCRKDQKCTGPSMETRDCAHPECDDLPRPESEWTEFGECSDKCGGGIHSRTRKCLTDICVGHDEEIQNCNEEACSGRVCVDRAVDCRKRKRRGLCSYRTIINICQKTCNAKGCSDVKEEPPWTGYGPCSVTCGVGVITRFKGSISQSITCFEDKCEEADENAIWGPWINDTGCSVKCGGGVTRSVRVCSVPNKCQGPSENTLPCQTQPCKVEAEWQEWGDWDDCSVTCGPGTKARYRKCTVEGACEGLTTATAVCNEKECDKIEWAAWSAWSDCTLLCGGGQALRVRTCTLEGMCGDLSGQRQEVSVCNTELCAVWSRWSGWGGCSATCGGGERKRMRSCQVEGGCQELPEGREETEECNPNACPVWTSWSFWSRCSRSCGDGTKKRSRFCSVESLCGNLPEGKEQTEDCNVESCEVISPWSPWSPCTLSCGGGKRLRVKTCPITGQCGKAEEQSEDCNLNPCPEWDDWSNWGKCSKTCEEGERTKTRSCSIPNQCNGESEEREKCILKTICDDDGRWSKCSRSCGGGTRKRYLCNGTQCAWKFESCGEGSCPELLCSFIATLSNRYGVEHACCPTPHLPSGEQCGRTASEKRVIGGKPALAEQWPWMVAVYIKQGGFCGGVLISNRFVLSAAHCFAYDSGLPKDTTDWKIFVGLLELSEVGKTPELAVRIKRTFIHPSYTFPVSDIAVVELENDVSFTTTIQPICLPWGEETPLDSTCIVAGWGVSNVPDTVTNHLQELAILNYDPLLCAEAYGKHENLQRYVEFLTENKGFMCAGSLTKLIDSCSGDSGGPLMCQRCKSCTWYVAGIVSFGPNPCALREVPGVYSKVLYYEDWILTTTGMNRHSLSCSIP